MKKLILLLFISSILFSQEAFCNNNINLNPISEMNDSMKEPIQLGINYGYRFNLNSNPSLNSNSYFGFFIELPLSDKISLQPEVNFWKAERKNPLHQNKLSVVDVPLNIVIKADLANKGVSLSLGLGMVYENNSKKLVSVNTAGKFWYNIYPSLELFTQIRLQVAASLEPGGGDSFTSLFLGTGLQAAIN
jgi:hypothetical protein